MKSKDFLSEGFIEDASDVHMDHEVQMAREECYHAAEHALAIHKLLRNVTEQQGLEGWVSSKITLANDYLNTVREHLEYELLNGGPESLDQLAIGMPIAETSDYARRREREEKIISGQKPARQRAPAQTSDYAKRREKEKKGVAEGPLNELAPNPGGGDGGGGDEGDDGFELPLDFKAKGTLVWPKNKKYSMGDTATPFPRGERFTGKAYIMWDKEKIEVIFYLDPKDRKDREAEYERVYGPNGRGWDPYLPGHWYDTTTPRYRIVTSWRLIPAKEPGGWPRIVDAWGQDMIDEVMNHAQNFINNIIHNDGDGRHFVEPKQSVTEGSEKTFTVVYYSKKTDRNVTKQIKASSESELWDRLRANGIDVVSVKEQGVAEGAKCNHTMEGENCPVHGLQECPGMKARALAEWRKAARAKRDFNTVNETTAGSVAGVVNPKSDKPKSKIGSLFGGTYKQQKKKA